MRKIALFAFIGTLLFQQISGQVGNCDSLQIYNMKINPFDTDFLMVRAGYTDFDNFINYPGFAITDEEEFILALEEVNYFGMSLEQIHMLEILNMEVEEGQLINGNLELWSGFFDVLECEYPGPFIWWPEQACVPLELTINTFSSDTISGQVGWNITSPQGETVAQGDYSLSTEESIFSWDFCLEAGCDYLFEITADSLVGPGFSYAMHYSDFLAIGANGIVAENTEEITAFNLYDCTITAEDEEYQHVWTVFPNPASDQFVLAFEKPLEHTDDIRIFDINGRQMPIPSTLTNHSTKCHISCEQWSSGVYNIVRTDALGISTSRRLVVY